MFPHRNSCFSCFAPRELCHVMKHSRGNSRASQDAKLIITQSKTQTRHCTRRDGPSSISLLSSLSPIIIIIVSIYHHRHSLYYVEMHTYLFLDGACPVLKLLLTFTFFHSLPQWAQILFSLLTLTFFLWLLL